MSAPTPPTPPDLPAPGAASAASADQRPARTVGEILFTLVVRPLAWVMRPIEFALTRAGDLFVFVLCWIGLTEPTWAELRRRTYLDFRPVPPHAVDAALVEFRFQL